MKRVGEPVRKSLFDVVKKNLRAAGKIINITRVIYIGKYSGTNSDLEKRLESIIQNLQTEYANVRITGLFLVYPQLYVHILEASEEIIYKYFKLLHESNNNNSELGRSIFLPCYHHVHQRFFTEWFHVFLIPPSLFDIPTTYELGNIKEQMTNCLTKVYRLCDNIANTVRDQDVVSNLNDKVLRILPESTVVEYLLNAPSPVLLSVEEYLQTHSIVPFINLYQDSIWPPPRDFMFANDCGKDTGRRVGSTISKH